MRIVRRIKSTWDTFISALGPEFCTCLLCDDEDYIGGDGLCDACRQKLLACPDPTFSQPLDGVTAGLQYSEEVIAAVIRLKKYKKFIYALFFAQYMHLKPEWKVDLLVPVPQYPLIESIRGYNHSTELCRQLSGTLGIPMSREVLFKIRLTRPQKTLNRKERKRNLKHAFYAREHVKGLNIVLVDDVFTTGSTAAACAAALKKAGARRVYCCCATAAIR